MSKKLLYLFGILLTLVLGAFLYQNFCCNCCVKSPQINDSSGISATGLGLNPFKIQGDGFNYLCNDNVKFVKNESVAIVPFSDSIALGFEKLQLVLKEKPNTKVKITGYATSDEMNTSSFTNLGLARANDLKNILVSKGFDTNAFALEGVVKEKWEMISDTLIGPVSFELFETELANAKEWETLKTTINSNPLMLYFDTNEVSENLNADEQARIAAIVNYMKNVPAAKVSIVGHSDSVGSRDLNLILGDSRAAFAKAYLVKKGIDSDAIQTSSQGPDSPIADNATEAGRAKNRRTVITIK